MENMNNEKTLKQIADEIGVDKNRVYRYVKKNNIPEVSSSSPTKKYYDIKAIEQIKKHFNSLNSTFCKNDKTQDLLYEILVKQLEIKDKQIEALTNLLISERQ